jgi:protein-S-isoprenylcysteine O-methyltransferase Ste14
MAGKFVSVVGLLAMAGALLVLVLTWSAFATGPVGWAVQAAAAGLMIWARRTFGIRSFHAVANPTAGDLVTTGPYRYLRHPIYAAVLWFTWTGALSHLSARNAGLAVLGTIGATMRIMAEERFLRVQYPEYAAYAARTERVIPFIF